MDERSASRAMREAFDARFREPLSPEPRDRLRLVVVTLAGAPFALRLGDLSGITALDHLVRLPGRSRFFLGIAGVRGRVVPVFDLAALIGAGSASRRRSWLALTAEPSWIGLCCESLGGYLEATAADVSTAHQGSPHVREIVRPGGAASRLGSASPFASVPILEVASVLDALGSASRGEAS